MARAPNTNENSDTTVIEPALHEDAPALKALVDAAYTKYIAPVGMLPAAMRVQYDQIIGKQEVYVLRARKGGEIAGSIILGREGDSVTVRNLVVDPSQQGRGFGRILMKLAEDKAREEGRAAVQLFTNERMVDNHVLYAKLGFVETGRRTEEGFKRVYYRKDLV